MSEPFIAEVRMFGCNYAPQSWAFCEGQLLPIAQNTALFSIIGTTYGGDGRTTMGLPNLTGRAPMQHGNGPGLTTRYLGQSGGADTVVLETVNMPSHDHILNAYAEPSTSATSANDLYMGKETGPSSENSSYLSTETTVNTELAQEAIGHTGKSQAHENQQPFLAVNFCIALFGVYPSRN